MTNVASHNGRDVVAAEAADFGAAPDAAEDDDGGEKKETAAAKRTLDDAEAATLASWMVRTLDERLESVEATSRLTSSPAVVVDAESGAMRRMMAMVSQESDGADLPPLPKQKLQVNPAHPVVVALYEKAAAANDATPDALAESAAHQLLDNAIVAAGLMDDPRTMLPRLTKLLELALLKK